MAHKAHNKSPRQFTFRLHTILYFSAAGMAIIQTSIKVSGLNNRSLMSIKILPLTNCISVLLEWHRLGDHDRQLQQLLQVRPTKTFYSSTLLIVLLFLYIYPPCLTLLLQDVWQKLTEGSDFGGFQRSGQAKDNAQTEKGRRSYRVIFLTGPPLKITSFSQ